METEGLFRIHIPVIAVTANARSEQILSAKDSGMVNPRITLSKMYADHNSGRCDAETVSDKSAGNKN